jgi:iron complex outermembrane receptor protein
MNLIDCNDGINIAMRGIYSNMQEKILFLLNGHRLNSYLTNAAQPDFSMSLEKIRQIEVLRGPASSVYGGVALTAVVNIITKQGADVDGIRAKAEGGNHGQLRGDILIGKRYFDLDVLAWLSAYHSKGEQRTVGEEHQSNVVRGDTVFPVNTISIGRIGSRPNYDAGVQLTLRGWKLLYNVRYSQVVAPYTFVSTAYAYDYDRYTTHNGIAPSLASLTHHANLGYTHEWGLLNLKFTAFYDNEDMTQYQVLSETKYPELAESLEASGYRGKLLDVFKGYDGLSSCTTGQGKNFGLQLKGDYNYALGRYHKGSLVLGAEYSHFFMEDVRYKVGYNYVNEIYAGVSLREKAVGRENSANASLQLKHQWRSLILNVGLRYDHKHRFDDTEANECSPRIALILLKPKWNLKFSYSKSFVDAPYFYRLGNLMRYLLQSETPIMTTPLSPERLHSWQLSFAGNNWVKGLHFEVNGFYNRASDLIATNFLAYTNAGKNQTAGVEFTANYQLPRFSANLNLTWAHTLKSNIVSYVEASFDEEFDNDLSHGIIDSNNNTPALTSNIVLTWQATPQLKFHAHALIESQQSTYFYDINKYCYMFKLVHEFSDKYPDIEDSTEWDVLVAKIMELASQPFTRKDMPARAIVNLGADYQIGKLTLGLNIHNLFDTCYDRSGMNTNLVPQQGRWWTVSVGYKI